MTKRTLAATGIVLVSVLAFAFLRESTGFAQTKIVVPLNGKEASAVAAVAPPSPQPAASGSWAGVAAVATAESSQTAAAQSAAPQSTAPQSAAPESTEAKSDPAPKPAGPAVAPKMIAPPHVIDPPPAQVQAREPVLRAPAPPPLQATRPPAKPAPVILAQSKASPADVMNKVGGAMKGAAGSASGQGSGAKPAPAAARSTSSDATPPTPIAALPPTTATITIEINRGQVVRLPRPATTVFIANPDIADVQVKSPNLVYVYAKKGGETTLIAVDGQDEVMLESRVLVTSNQQRLRDSLKDLMPDRDITISSVGEQVVLEGKVASPVDVENARRLAAAVVGDEKKVINRLQVASPLQVMLRVRVAEMSKDTSKQLGFNWAVLRDAAGVTPFSFAFSMLDPNRALTNNTLLFSGRTGYWDVNTLIDAMEDERLVKVLAQPTLTAMSGQTASFLVGGEFPIPVPQDENTITITFKQFGVALAFQPTVLDGNRINLHVRPEVSELSDQGAISVLGIQVPALQVRRAETTVEVGSGQSFALAGLLRNDVTHSINKWPGLADIPILGTLFRSDLFQRRESELVIIVTPYLVEPTNTPLASPTDGYKPPHDVDRIFFGSQWKRESVPGTTNPAPPRSRLAGPVGFQLE